MQYNFSKEKNKIQIDLMGFSIAANKKTSQNCEV